MHARSPTFRTCWHLGCSPVLLNSANSGPDRSVCFALRTSDWTSTSATPLQSEASRAEAEAAEKRRWSFLEVETARDEEVNEAGQAVQVSKQCFL